jgi:hypothetical protein
MLAQTYLEIDIQPSSNYPLVISDNEMAALFTSLTSHLQQENLFQPSSGGLVAGVVPSGIAYELAFIGFLCDLPGELASEENDVSGLAGWGKLSTGASITADYLNIWPVGTQIEPNGNLILSVLYVAQQIYEADYFAYNNYTFPMTSQPSLHETVDFLVCGANELEIVVPLSSTPQTSVDLQCALGNWNWGVGGVTCDGVYGTQNPQLPVYEYSYNFSNTFNSAYNAYGHPKFKAYILDFFGKKTGTDVLVPAGPPPFQIYTSNSPFYGSTNSGSIGAYSNSTVTVNATANPCFSFENWTENGNFVTTSPTYTFTATGSRNLTANFVTNLYVINTFGSPTNGGATTGSAFVACGTSVTVTANTNDGYAFGAWEDDNSNVVSTSSIYTFTVSSNTVLVAIFNPLGSSFIATIASPPSAGSTTGGGTYVNGQSETLTATVSDSCYTFVNWTTNGTPVGTSTNCTFTVATNQLFVANFVPIPYNIALSSSPAAGGITAGGGAAGCGTNLTIYATPNSCYTFVNWTENGNVVSWFPYYTFTVGGSHNFVANFTPTIYSISTGSLLPGGGSTSGGGTTNCGASVTVAATASSGYTFLNWLENGNVVSMSPSYSFTATSDRVLVANFVPNTPLLGFSTPLWSTNGFGLMLQGPIGSNYEIDASTDLLTWLLFTNFTSTNSPFYFSDPAATNFNQRFYRVVLP